MKEKTVFDHEHNIVYYTKCTEESCPHEYVGESSRRVLEQVKDHNCRDTSSHIFKHCVATDHQFVSCNELRFVGRNYGNNKRKRKIAEVLLIKNLKPSINVQEKSIALKPFNQLRFLDAPIPMSFHRIYVAMSPFNFRF